MLLEFLSRNATPVAIAIASVVIAGSIYARSTPVASTTVAYASERSEFSHVYGNEDAPTKIIEFSDIECPYCAQIHPTLKQLVDESNGTLAWEFRHFPLPSHKNAETAARAAECVGRLAGNEAFWSFLDFAFQNQRLLTAKFYEDTAGALGVSEDALFECTENPDIHESIANDVRTSVSLGGTGTPFSIIQYEDGSLRPVSGALPIEQWRSLLNK